jgi:ArsR family transcriptional regulator
VNTNTSAEFFKKVAPKWDEMQKTLFDDRVALKAIKAAGVVAGQSAADIGAGAGFLSGHLLDTGAAVIAVDPEPGMLTVMEQKFSGRIGFETRLGEAEHLPLRDAEVNCALANMMLHHSERPDDAVKEMARVVKPGGAVVITDMDAHNHSWLLTEHADRWPGFDRAVVRQWFEAAGLSRVEVVSAEESCCATSCCGAGTATVTIFLAIGWK